MSRISVPIADARVAWPSVATLLFGTACSPVVTVADDSLISVAGASGVNAGAGGSVISTGGAAGSGANESVLVSKLTPEQSAALESAACNGWAVEPESSPTKLELVVDVSSSMNNAAPGTERSKWEVTRDALLEAVVGVTSPGLPAYVSVGLMFYPNKNNDFVSTTPTDASQCLNTTDAVPMNMLGGSESGSQRSLLRQRFAHVDLGRGTPTVDAYNWALNHSVLSAEQLAVAGDAYMLLMTDGMPTLNEGCWNPSGDLKNLDGSAVVSAVDQAYRHSVKTFVVGSPGSEDGRLWLSQAAYVGGTAVDGCDPNSRTGSYCHMDMTTAPDFSLALRNGLAKVVAAVSSCKFEVPTESADGTRLVDVERINPIVKFSDGTIYSLGRNPSANVDCTIGFRLISNTQLEFCKDTCAEYRNDPGAFSLILIDCTSDEIQSSGLI